jgi:hypothetical protein
MKGSDKSRKTMTPMNDLDLEEFGIKVNYDEYDNEGTQLPSFMDIAPATTKLWSAIGSY